MRSKYQWGLLCFLGLCMLALRAEAQTGVGINTAGAAPRAQALLDIVEPTKGMMIPRVSLQATNVAAPIPTPANSLLVYNTAKSALIGTNAQFNVSPGYYAWDANGQRWQRFTLQIRRPAVYKATGAFNTMATLWSIPAGLESVTMELRTGDRVELSAAGTLTTSTGQPGFAQAEVQLAVNNGLGYAALPFGGTTTLSVDNEATVVAGTTVQKALPFANYGLHGTFEVPADGSYTFAVRVRRISGNTSLAASGTGTQQGALKVEVVRQ